MSEENTTDARRGPRGPRKYPEKATPRERLMCENLAAAIKEFTGRDVSAETARAFRFGYPRWYKSDATKALMADVSAKLKKQKAQEKREKALADLREAEAELEDLVADDSDEDDEDTDDEDADYEDEEDEDEEDDAFEDDKVSSTF